MIAKLQLSITKRTTSTPMAFLCLVLFCISCDNESERKTTSSDTVSLSDLEIGDAVSNQTKISSPDPASRQNDVQRQENQLLRDLIEDEIFEPIILPDRSGTDPGEQCVLKDSSYADLTSLEGLTQKITNKSVKQICGENKPCAIGITVSNARWRIDENSLREVVQSYVVSRIERKHFHSLKFQYPAQFTELQQAYKSAVKTDPKLLGIATKYPLLDIPARTERIIEAMLFYGFDAVFLRSPENIQDEEMFSEAIESIVRTIDRYFSLRFDGIVSTDLLTQMQWEEWDLPRPSEGHERLVQALFQELHTELKIQPSVSPIPDNFWIQLEIGGGNHFHYTRFIVPTESILSDVVEIVRAGEYPIRRPECYFTRVLHKFSDFLIGSVVTTKVDNSK